MISNRVCGVCCVLISVAGTAMAAENQVSGNVRLNGEPLGSARMTFYLKNGEFVGTAVNNGLYSFTKVQVPTGRFKVTIEGEGVPAKFSRKNATVLEVEVRPGDNHFDFDLTK